MFASIISPHITLREEMKTLHSRDPVKIILQRQARFVLKILNTYLAVMIGDKCAH